MRHLSIFAETRAIKVPELLSRVKEFMLQNGMPSPESHVLVAVSGGADSVALALILTSLGYSIEICHCNFGLRGNDSDEDEQFVIELASKLKARCHIRRFSHTDLGAVRGEGIQQAARRLRYAFFEELLNTRALDGCAIAHHADDQLENLIQSFFRGNGPVILHAMPAQRGAYFRPLLRLRKQEIKDWLARNSQSWRHDRSNDKEDYKRNLVRNQLIPALTQLNPGFKERFQLQAERYAAQWSLLNSVFSNLKSKVSWMEDDVQVVSKSAFGKEFDKSHFPTFLDWWLVEMGCSGTEILEIQRLGRGEVGSTYKGVVFEVLNDRDRLCFRRATVSANIPDILISKDQCDGIQLNIGNSTLMLSTGPFVHNATHSTEPEIHWLSLASLEFPLQIRRWRQGDRMQPLGMQGSKLISDILVDQKRSRFQKDQAWVLTDNKGIVLLGGYRIAQRVVADVRNQCLKIEVHRSA